MAEQKLEKAFTASQVLCNESVEVRAILHTVVKQATMRWQQNEEPTAQQGGSDMGAGNQQAAGASADTQGGQAAGAGVRTGAGDGSRREGAVEDDGLIAGLGGQQKRRRACDIGERPFKCSHLDCSAHAGFTNRGGLDRHRKKKHPGAVPEREGASGGGDDPPAAPVQDAEPRPFESGSGASAPTASSPSPQANGGSAKEPAKAASGAPVDETTTSAPGASPEGAAAQPSIATPTPIATRTTDEAPAPPAGTPAANTLGRTSPGRDSAPNNGAAHGPAGQERRPISRAPQGGLPSQSTAAGTGLCTEPPGRGPRLAEPDVRETIAPPRKPSTGLRSKRQPRAAVPLRPMDANRPQQTGRKRRNPEATGVYFETLEEYADYMINSGGEKRVRHVRGTSMRTFVKRRKEREAKLRASVPDEVARKALIEAIEARPCKTLYRMVGSDEFQLLVSGSAEEQTFVALYDVEPEILVEFAKASKIDYAGVEPWRLRWKIYQALDLEVLRDIGVLPENGDHLRE